MNLSPLITSLSGFEQIIGSLFFKDWSRILSVGEQQRLGFVRILLNKPNIVILDESTSALDEMNEKNAYKLLLENSIKYISVGHRPNLIEYHQLSLTLFEDGTHKVEKI